MHETSFQNFFAIIYFPSLFDAFEPVFGDPGKSSIDPPHPPIQGVKVSNLGMICNLKKEDSKRIGHSDPFPTPYSHL